jgi:hypothetical protein
MELFQIISLILVGIVIIFTYILINLLRKVERYEDYTDKQVDLTNRIFNVIKKSSEKLQEIDSKGSFQSDDEVGFFFRGIREIQNLIEEAADPDYAKKEKQS